MATTSVVLEYTIHLTDAAQVAALQAADAGLPIPGSPKLRYPAAVHQAPDDAAAEFNAPIQLGAFAAPGITSPWFTSEANYPRNEQLFVRKSGGWFGLTALFGDSTTYYWFRRFAYAPAPGTTGAGPGAVGDGGVLIPPAATPISNRRWVDGADLPPVGLGNTSSSPTPIVTRAASRHVDGLGWAFRHSGASDHRAHTLAGIIGGGPFTDSWERFYLRLRRRPSANSNLWSMSSNPSPLLGMRLQIGPAGEIIAYSSDPFGALTLHASAGVLPLDAWVRVDLLIKMTAPKHFRVYVNGALGLDLGNPPGLSGTGHVRSYIGGNGGGAGYAAAAGLELDVDDWINAEPPTTTLVAGTPVITDPSWYAGSRCTLIKAAGVATPGTWTHPVEGWRAQLPQFPEVAPPLAQSSAAALDMIVYDTDAARSVDALAGSLGVGAFVVACNNFASGAVDGRLGYALAGGAPNLATHDNPITQHGWTRRLYNGGVPTPLPLAGLQLVLEHSNSAQTESVAGFFAEAEVIGHWGVDDEDPRAPSSTTPTSPAVAAAFNGVHNSPYPLTPWATARVMAPAPVAIYGGTYVGTGDPTDLFFNLPIHWLWIRPLTGVNDGGRWWSSMLTAGHVSYLDGTAGSLAPDITIDPDFAPAAALDAQEIQCSVRLLGHSQDNALGVTYQYIAVSDAAMRFLFNGACAHNIGDVVASNPLWDVNFLAQAGFFWNETPGSAGITAQLWYKGLGHATSAATKLNSAETVTAADFLAGAVRTYPAIHALSGAGIPFSLWRRDDASGDPGVPRVVQLGSYVGDGTASRVINLTPLSARRPLFGLVTPHNATPALYRDPSHTTTTSSQINNTANAATGIIAGGIDEITVGIALNATGIVYDVFVLPGDTAAGNAGWSINGTFIPIEPGTGGNPGGEPLPEFFDPVTGGGVDIVNDLDTDLAAACTVATHKLVNLALSKIGVTTRVVDLATDLTPEADRARLHYTDEVQATLRDYPWAFATRYRSLTLVRGPVLSATVPVQRWSATQAYTIGDTIETAGGVVYYCLLDHLNVVPSESAWWTETPTRRAEEDWAYAYRVPTNLIYARRIVQPGMARRFDPHPPPFRIGQDATGDLIYTDQADAQLEYTYRPPCAAGAGDALFREALTWRLAHAFAPGLAKDAKRQQYCWEMYRHTLARATVPSANEQQAQRPGDGDPDWIAGRN